MKNAPAKKQGRKIILSRYHPDCPPKRDISEVLYRGPDGRLLASGLVKWLHRRGNEVLAAKMPLSLKKPRHDARFVIAHKYANRNLVTILSAFLRLSRGNFQGSESDPVGMEKDYAQQLTTEIEPHVVYGQSLILWEYRAHIPHLDTTTVGFPLVGSDETTAECHQEESSES